MVERLSVITTRNTVPYRNIALEKLLLDSVAPGHCFLYLWQNENTVVIGRNQSALDEVRVAELEAAGGHLARRLSGGGAVYHDLGNLNFTFVARRADFDVERQTEVILRAVRALGVAARRTGRNDLVADVPGDAPGAPGEALGGKFSGHAYYRTGDACYHHGTLMVDVDLAALGRYLRPAPDKLAAKGVRSVRSRVVNLAQAAPGLTVEALAGELPRAFEAEYGHAAERMEDTALGAEALTRIETLTGRFASREWLFRDERAFERKAHARFAWGGVTLRYTLRDGAIAACALDSDGLEADFLARVPELLQGCPLHAPHVEDALIIAAKTPAEREVAEDVASVVLGGVRGLGAING